MSITVILVVITFIHYINDSNRMVLSDTNISFGFYIGSLVEKKLDHCIMAVPSCFAQRGVSVLKNKIINYIPYIICLVAIFVHSD